jgi:hypothetical protein
MDPGLRRGDESESIDRHRKHSSYLRRQVSIRSGRSHSSASRAGSEAIARNCSTEVEPTVSFGPLASWAAASWAAGEKTSLVFRLFPNPALPVFPVEIFFQLCALCLCAKSETSQKIGAKFTQSTQPDSYVRHSREGGSPSRREWIPAFAGMTTEVRGRSQVAGHR